MIRIRFFRAGRFNSETFFGRTVCRVALSCHYALGIGCPWNGKQGSDCQDAQIELCGPASTCLKAWKAGKRLLHAQPHCVYGTICNGIMAVRQEVRRLGQYRTKGQTWSKRTQERITASTAERPSRRVVPACAYTCQCVEKQVNDYNTPSLTASMVVMGTWQWGKSYGGWIKRSTEAGLGPWAPRTRSECCLSFA